MVAMVNFISTWLHHGMPKLNIISRYVQVFPDEISIWTGGLRKIDCLPQCGWASSNPLRPLIEQKAEEGGICLFVSCLPAWAGTLVFSCLWTRIYTISSPGSQAFGIGLKLQHWLLWFFSSQMADHGTSQPPWSHEPIPHNKSLYLSLYLYLSIGI